MKEATGEMNMTVVTIIAIGAIVAFFWFMWPTIQNAISGSWTDSTKCGKDQFWDGNACVSIKQES